MFFLLFYLIWRLIIRSRFKYIILSWLYLFSNLTCIGFIKIIKVLLGLKRILIYYQNFIAYGSGSSYVVFAIAFTISIYFDFVLNRNNYFLLGKNKFATLFVLVNLYFVWTSIGHTFSLVFCYFFSLYTWENRIDFLKELVEVFYSHWVLIDILNFHHDVV